MKGTVIAERYRLIEPIGKGGFGEVWRAEQIGVGREVAMKLMHRQTLDTAAHGRFKREADLARRLEHPNTVRLLDFGMYTPDTPYIVFELLRGSSLAELLHREGKLPEERVIRIATQVLKSLMEAHALGVVHRDIKPANIFVAEHAGEPDFVKVLDFGIAKSLYSNSKFKTQTGEVVGTPRYMSPEQVTGRAVTPRWDVWSVGIVVAEMLLGGPVYRGQSVDVMIELASPDPVPLPRELADSPLLPFIRRATRKNPDERFASASEMLDELARVEKSPPRSLLATTREQAPVPAPAWTVEATTKPIFAPSTAPPPPLNKTPWLVVGAALVVGLLIVVGGVTLVVGVLIGRDSAPAPTASVVAPAAVSSPVPSVTASVQNQPTPKPPAAPAPKKVAAPKSAPATKQPSADFGY